MEFLLIKNLNLDAILGTDKLDRNKDVIDYNKQMQISDEIILMKKLRLHLSSIHWQ